MIRRLLPGLALAGWLGAVPSAADELTLRDAMSLARAQAREVAAAQARVEAGQQRARQARAYRYPKLSIQEVWMRTDSPAEAFALQLNQERFSFPDFVASDPNNPDPIQNALTRLEVSLPIYTGGEISGRVRQAKLAAGAAEDSAVWIEDEAALAAAEAWIQLAQVNEQVMLLSRSLETVDAHVALARAYVDQGMLVRSELLRAEVERSRIQDLLTEAQGHQRVAQANLAFRLASPEPFDFELAALPDPAPLAASLESWLADAATRRDLTAARLLLEAGEEEVDVARSRLLPKLAVSARYDLNDDKLFGSNGQAGAIMAMASIDLFGGGHHRAAAAAARAEIEAAAAEIEQFEEAVRLQIRQAFERASTARERQDTARQAQEAAVEAERIVEQRFKQGIVKMLDLLDASTAHREADTRELVARADAHLASLRLAMASGRRPESILP